MVRVTVLHNSWMSSRLQGIDSVRWCGSDLQISAARIRHDVLWRKVRESGGCSRPVRLLRRGGEGTSGWPAPIIRQKSLIEATSLRCCRVRHWAYCRSLVVGISLAAV
ncbi:unnamed protein product [Ixodes persulcatus]